MELDAKKPKKAPKRKGKEKEKKEAGECEMTSLI